MIFISFHIETLFLFRRESGTKGLISGCPASIFITNTNLFISESTIHHPI